MKHAKPSQLAEELRPGETLLWTGEPAKGIRFRSSDMVMIPFSLIWFGFAVFWEIMALMIPKGQVFGWLFPLFGIPFVAVGFYMLAGRFIVDAKRRDATRYAVTDRRILIGSEFPRRKTISVSVEKLKNLSVIENADGTGTIEFGDRPAGWGSINGMSWFGTPWPGVAQVPAFEMIGNVKRVQSFIEDARALAAES